jgi:hypothetical protein
MIGVVEAAHHAEQVRLFAQQAQQRRHQADAFAADADAEVEVEPVVADALLDRDEPVFRLRHAIREVRRELYLDALPFQFGDAFIEEGEPADDVAAARHQAVGRAFEALVTAQAALPAFESRPIAIGARQCLPFQVALQRAPLAIDALPHKGRRLLGAEHVEPLRIVEVQHRKRHLVVQAAHGQVAEASPG